MSTLIQLSNEVSTQGLSMVAPAADGGSGFLDWLTTKNTQVQSVLRAVAVTLGIVFVIIQGVASRGAMARIIVSLIAAGIFVWGVWSVTDIKDRVEQEVGLGPALARVDPGARVAAAAAGFPAAALTRS